MKLKDKERLVFLEALNIDQLSKIERLERKIRLMADAYDRFIEWHNAHVNQLANELKRPIPTLKKVEAETNGWMRPEGQ